MDKLYKKQKRKQAQYLKQEPETDIKFQEEPSIHVFVGNGGLKNGVPRELLEHVLNTSTSDCSGLLEHLYLPSGKDYAFATFTSALGASEVVQSLNGVCVQDVCKANQSLLHILSPAVLNGPPVHLYLSYVNKIPSNILDYASKSISDCSQLPPGLILILDFISAQEEEQLLKFFTFSHENQVDIPNPLEPVRNDSPSPQCQSSTDEVSSEEASLPMSASKKLPDCGAEATKGSATDECSVPRAALKHRRVMHYGYEFIYGSNLVDPTNPLPGGLPRITHPLLDRMVERGLVDETGCPDQLTVNEYSPGAGIPSHVDTHSVFQGPILSLSLGSQVVMEFKHHDGRRVAVFLPPRSLLAMTGEARYLWSHGIPARKYDEVFPGLLGYPGMLPKNVALFNPERNVVCRTTRTSLTFRKIGPVPFKCTCGYPLHCDSVTK